MKTLKRCLVRAILAPKTLVKAKMVKAPELAFRAVVLARRKSAWGPNVSTDDLPDDARDHLLRNRDCFLFVYAGDIDNPDPESIVFDHRTWEPVTLKSEHSTHCCKEHGCKYRDPNCPIAHGNEEQLFPCFTCNPDTFYGREPMPAEPTFDLNHIFTYHAPGANDLAHYTALREAAKVFAEVIIEHTPQGADQSAAIRKVREAVMTANAAVALKGRLGPGGSFQT